ncbi:MAG: phosphatase PAP2 family protein [Chloroflexi bacterium]|nr:phosphatase PAP2 family protein [Chloroflexota bacterium]
MHEVLSLPFRLEILTLTLLGWLVIYFFVNRLQVDPDRRLDLGLSIDRKIPFMPLFALAYFSTYIFVILPFLVLSDARQFYWMLVSFVAISVISSLIHAIVPSKIERVEQVNAAGFSGKLLTLFQATCKPYGNFPSMHVGLSVPVVAVIFMTFGAAAGSMTLIWAILIAISTLFTKQHYILDVLAGFAAGLMIFGLTFWLMMA